MWSSELLLYSCLVWLGTSQGPNVCTEQCRCRVGGAGQQSSEFPCAPWPVLMEDEEGAEGSAGSHWRSPPVGWGAQQCSELPWSLPWALTRGTTHPSVLRNPPVSSLGFSSSFSFQPGNAWFQSDWCLLRSTWAKNRCLTAWPLLLPSLLQPLSPGGLCPQPFGWIHACEALHRGGIWL